MTIEKKAKRYDEALEKARNIVNSINVGLIGKDSFEAVFPELAESEDEKIRKALIFHYQGDGCICTNEYRIDFKDIRAWLEKQGEHKPYDKEECLDCLVKKAENFLEMLGYGFTITDNITHTNHDKEQLIEDIKNYMKRGEQKLANKVEPKFDNVEEVNFFDDFRKTDSEVEPKFKERDWVIIDGETLHITNVTEDGYSTEEGGYIPFRCEKDARHWTIQDAKEGDVLFYRGNVKYSDGIKFDRILLFENLDKSFFVLSKCSNGVEEYGINENIDYPDNIMPATKEQKEILFMAMKGAGYVWDTENKELKKIEQKPANKVEPIFNVGDKIQYSKGCGTIMTIEKIENGEYIFANNMGHTTIESGNKWYLVEQNLAWSEEDERTYRGLHNLIYSTPYCDSRKELSDWLKSLKDRVQPKQEWDKEDEQILNAAILHIKNETYNYYGGHSSEYIMQWLKSLKDRVQPRQEWSEEDEKHLKLAIDNFQTLGNSFLTSWLKSLKNRVQPQPKQEWSEEDETRLTNTIIMLKEGASLHFMKNDITKAVDWLKSLRPQYNSCINSIKSIKS